MKAEKLFAVLLTSALFLTAVSCKDTADEKPQPVTTTAQEETTSSVPDLKIPSDVDYGGKTFTVEAVVYGDPIHNPFAIEEMNGEILNDTIFSAVCNVEALLNIDLVQAYSKDVFDYGRLRTAAMSGDDSIDVFSYIDRFGTNQSAGGYVVPYESIPTIDLSMPWWYSEVNEAISIAGHYCFAIGAMNMDVVANMQTIVFNKRILESYNLDNPYQLVDDGKWTIDTMYRMISDVATDLDGDSQMTVDDLYGAVYTHDVWYNNFGPLSGEFIVEKDKDDLPYMNVLGNDHLLSIWQKLLNYATSDDVFYIEKLGDSKKYNLDGSIYNEVLYMFADGKALFSSSMSLVNIDKLRNMEDDFGIIPFPKEEEVSAGSIYGSYINGIGQPYFVPASNSDLELTGYVFEALCRENYINVVDTYLESVAMNKQIRDEESARMLKMMYSNKVVDISSGYWWEDTNAQMYNVFRSGNNTFVSTYEKQAAAADKALEKTIEIFRGFGEN